MRVKLNSQTNYNYPPISRTYLLTYFKEVEYTPVFYLLYGLPSGDIVSYIETRNEIYSVLDGEFNS